MFEIIKNIETQDSYYRAQVDDFEPIYQALEREEYLSAKDQSLEQINKGCLDPRYAIYAKFGYWYESTNFDINAEIVIDLIKIHQFFLGKVDENKIRIKAYSSIVEWLHTNMLTCAKFTRQNPNAYFEGNKSSLNDAFEEYITFIKESFSSINISQIYQLKDTCMTFQVLEEIEKCNDEQACDDISVDVVEIKKDNPEIFSLNPSCEWDKLLKNIKIYQKLVSDQSWLKAAVVYQIISSALKEFDPIKYFPETFYPYLKDTANVYDHLMHQLSLSSHPLWSMLSQMFNSDPDGFCTDDSLVRVKDILIQEINTGVNVREQEDYL
ncbi:MULTISPECIES: type VI secretion system protein IglI family protein [unclassified Francisella]|uniref:type VI secretion system protein IglI family protein n=1 Tax=unclassified Francisella TaxID=2610885 RepID=UPI002E32BB7F|nr:MULTISPECIES: type VI secretion system protein IglI family protein [unclassified Francisella]MED7818884.1 type VI secretion system protein IglI family protein [Francisella sp. 19S2-4]MED7829721.1 type VI secretion system protein IglI family protein [Francisella sp. 19S2-10]